MKLVNTSLFTSIKLLLLTIKQNVKNIRVVKNLILFAPADFELKMTFNSH